jgi:hypothetical protein
MHTHIVNDILSNNINCSCQEIERVKSFKYLEIIVDNHIKWNDHLTLIKIHDNIYFLQNK